MNIYQSGCAILANIAIALVGAQAIALSPGGSQFNPAHSLTAPTSVQLAQSLIGQCRTTGRLERVYTGVDLTTARIADLPEGTEVILAGDLNQPSFGWIRISYPNAGYIQTTFLVDDCASTTPTPAAPSPSATPTACGIVTHPTLTMRAAPNTESGYVRELSMNQGFKIIGGPQSQSPGPNGRVWVQIDYFGTTGWVAETGEGGIGSNFRRVSCASINLSQNYPHQLTVSRWIGGDRSGY